MLKKTLQALSLLTIKNKNMRELKNVEFYYTLKNDEKKYIVQTMECKAPERTKIYKSLKNDFNRCFIYSYGYQTKNK